MLHHLPISLISSVAGINNDGVVIGSINESSLVARYASNNLAPAIKVYRLDRTGSSLNILEETTIATSGTTNAWSPFNNNNLPLPAVLRVYDSIDGVWATNELTVSVGSINDFKTIGWKKIIFGENVSRASWKLTSDPSVNIPSRKYIRVELDDAGDKDSFVLSSDAGDIQGFLINITQAGSTTQPPKASEIRLIRAVADVKYEDQTTQANGSLTAAYTPTSNTYLPFIGRTETIIVSNPSIALVEYVFRKKGTNAETVTAEYYATNQWKPLTYASVSSFGNLGPATTTNPPTRFATSYDLPTDATSNSHSFALESGNVSSTGYAIRFRTTAVSAEGPINVAIVADRIKQFGTANTEGMTSLSSEVIKGLCIRGIGSHSGNVTVAKLIDMTTGDGRSFTIPASPTFPFTVDTDDITIPAGNKIGLAWVSGTGTITNIDLYIIQ